MGLLARPCCGLTSLQTGTTIVGAVSLAVAATAAMVAAVVVTHADAGVALLEERGMVGNRTHTETVEGEMAPYQPIIATFQARLTLIQRWRAVRASFWWFL